MLVRFNYLSQALRMQTNVTMCLPSFSINQLLNSPDSATEATAETTYIPGMRFQTVYMLHGAYGDDSDYLNYTNVARYSEENNVAVVMPNGYSATYVNDVRGDAQHRYWDFVADELPRVCETMFPLSPRREDRVIAGLSMGAGGAMNLAIQRNERFGTALLMSGAAWDTDTMLSTGGLGASDVSEGRDQYEALPVFKKAKADAESGAPLVNFIIATGGDDFFIPTIGAARDLLNEYGYEVTYDEVPGYAHNWEFWDLAVRKAFYEQLPLLREPIMP